MPNFNKKIIINSLGGESGVEYKDIQSIASQADSKESLRSAISLVNDDGSKDYGLKFINGKPRVTNNTYLQDIAEGNVPYHTPWTKNGYNGALGSSIEDLWATGGTIVSPTANMRMDVVSSDTDDTGFISFARNSTGGSTTSIYDSSVNFASGANAVSNGDIVFIYTVDSLEYKGYGVVTGVSSSILTISGGFSNGESGLLKYYRVLDRSASGNGAQVVKIQYLDSTFTEKETIVILNGTTPVTTDIADIYRVNYFRVKYAGVTGWNEGDIDIKASAPATTIYSRIASTTNRAINSFYTVPKDKVLYIYNLLFSAGSNVASRPVRFITKATYENASGSKIDFFMPYTNVIITDGSVDVPIECPTKFCEGVDIKVSAISPDGAAYGAVTMRGWLENE